jgi:hypothetical protein
MDRRGNLAITSKCASTEGRDEFSDLLFVCLLVR